MKLKNILLSSAIVLSSMALVPNDSVSANAVEWVDLGTHQNVDLNKVWTVNFSSNVSFNKIDAIVVKSGNTFVPVKMVKNAQKQLQIVPVLGYVGNTTYEMQISLKNGLKYKLAFTTKNAARDADLEPNNNYLKAQTIYVNDHVKGTINNEDSTDYYKVIVPADGRLDVQAVDSNGKSLDLYLYGVNGSDGYSISSAYNKITANVSAGLAAGTYYVRVANGSDNVYELTTQFTENEIANDNATNTYIQAPTLQLNGEVTGHIGFKYENGNDNSNDYYKVVLPENGTLGLEAIQLNGGELDFYVYGKNGSDGYPITSSYNASTNSASLRLQAGTYYIRLNDSGYYGAYSLKNTFTPEAVQNDNAASNYITAPTLPLNKTVAGHLGHFDETTGTNSDDYYKVVVEEQGTLQVHAKQLQGGELDLYLYGANGSDSYPLKSEYNIKQGSLSAAVSPGTYYVRLNNSGYSGTYELSAQLVK